MTPPLINVIVFQTGFQDHLGQGLPCTPATCTPEGVKWFLILVAGLTIVLITRKVLDYAIRSRQQKDDLTSSQIRHQQEVETAVRNREYELEKMEREERRAMVEAVFANSRSLATSQQLFFERSAEDDKQRVIIADTQMKILEILTANTSKIDKTNGILTQQSSDLQALIGPLTTLAQSIKTLQEQQNEWQQRQKLD